MICGTYLLNKVQASLWSFKVLFVNFLQLHSRSLICAVEIFTLVGLKQLTLYVLVRYCLASLWNHSSKSRGSEEEIRRITVLLVLFCVVRRCCYRILLLFELCKMANDHGENEKINKPSEDTVDVASTSFGNTNKLSNQEIFMPFKMQK